MGPSLAGDWDVERWGTHFGNSAKRKSLIEQFAQTSTVHGTAYVFSTGRDTSTCVKIFYRVLFVVCFLFVINNVSQLLQDYFGKHSTSINTMNRRTDIGFEEDPDWFPLYPRITICGRPFYKINYNDSYRQLVEYAMLSLGPPYTPLAPQNVTLLWKLTLHKLRMDSNLTDEEIAFKDQLDALEEQYEALKQKDDFNLKQFVLDHSTNCSEFFISCHIELNNHKCCDIFEPVITSNGVCFTLPNVELMAEYSRSGTDFSFVIDLTTPQGDDATHSEWGFRIFFDDPKQDLPAIYSSNEGQDISPTYATTIKAQLFKQQRTILHTPWHGLWDNCPKYRHNETYTSDHYSPSICHGSYFARMLEESCNCHYLPFESGSKDMRYCDPKDVYECVYLMGLMRENRSDTEHICEDEEPCVTYSYKTESSYISIGGNAETSRLKIVYNNKQYIYSEYRQTTLSSLLSQIGGSLGLYLGASIITLFEIVTFTASWLWYRLAPDTARVRPQHRTPFPTSRQRH